VDHPPIWGFTLAMILLMNFRLTEEKHQEIQAELMGRRTSNGLS
jgi:Na+/melibiose symporter-like transporter